jgi:outer membrane protein OmpA-like peptidoglycan-associated protein
MNDVHLNTDRTSHWVSISDLMSVLMMVFLFVSIVYMRHVSAAKERIEQIAITYQKLQNDLYIELYNEFEEDLGRWNADISRETLTIRFLEPSILFERGDSDISGNFQLVLDSFFPRYLNILRQPKFVDDIEEIRIEGHTSSEWRTDVSKDNAYFFNMELSQNRTRSVMKYAFNLVENDSTKEWLKLRLTANGLSSSHIILDENRNEDSALSRRVDFRVRTNAESRIVRIISDQ